MTKRERIIRHEDAARQAHAAGDYQNWAAHHNLANKIESSLNKYGETVPFHGPVCCVCHQRIAPMSAIAHDKLGGNICTHCTR